MPSTDEPRTSPYPIEVVIGLLFISIVVGIVAWDEVVAMVFFVLLTVIYLLYRILRTLELIATKL
ncbi:hypothetical protein HWV07_08560 [Natronomonas salina]|uniref:hypothetical protein n=1 Tax=Natronomonas salina TaxID=1710540 RepID=UPI0015B44F6D|nr:hypothetical protein [Natronomonas salina]QLD89078.1 hypothetical protein HWV07_08560 [Natronomonas salina]